MRTARLVLRLVGVVGASGVLALAFALLWLGAKPLGRGPRLQSRMTRVWARSCGRVLGLRVAVQGAPPDGPVLLVTNHLSYVDILLLGGLMPCAFVSKAEVAHWPGLGLLARLAGTVFVDRARRRDVVRVGEAMRRALDDGRAVVFFPEGTSTAGDAVAPFRSSLLEPAATLGLPVHYAAVHYRTPAGEVPARLSVAWWGDMEFAPHFLRLLRLPRIDARVVFGPAPISAPERKALAEALRGAVSAAFAPLLDGHEDEERAPGAEARAGSAQAAGADERALGSPG